MAMWMGTPMYFAVVLIRCIWGGGIDNQDGHELMHPDAYVTVTMESSLDQCNKDGTKWETAVFEGAMEGDGDAVHFNNGVWRCDVLATGGLETGYNAGNR